jgi:hypothetical protein
MARRASQGITLKIQGIKGMSVNGKSPGQKTSLVVAA